MHRCCDQILTLFHAHPCILGLEHPEAHEGAEQRLLNLSTFVSQNCRGFSRIRYVHMRRKGSAHLQLVYDLVEGETIECGGELRLGCPGHDQLLGYEALASLAPLHLFFPQTNQSRRVTKPLSRL